MKGEAVSGVGCARGDLVDGRVRKVQGLHLMPMLQLAQGLLRLPIHVPLWAHSPTFLLCFPLPCNPSHTGRLAGPQAFVSSVDLESER